MKISYLKINEVIYIKNIFIIINYNDFENTSKLVNCIKTFKILDEILIVDNNSTKKEEFVKLESLKNDKINIIKTKQNNGYGSAINFASKYIEKKYGNSNLFISNPDIIIEKSKDLEYLLKILKEKDVGIVSPFINENNVLNIGWKIPNIIDAIILNIPKFNKFYEKKYIRYDELFFARKNKEVEAVSGCFFVTKSDVIKEIGYFDENIFLYYEENTIAIKLKKHNYKSIITPNVIVLHNHSKTIDKNLNEYKKLYELKKSQYYYYKNIIKANRVLLFILKISNNLILFLKKRQVRGKNEN